MSQNFRSCSGATAPDCRSDAATGDIQKNAGHCQRGTLERYKRIEEVEDQYPIEVLCEALCASRSGCYQWVERRNKPSARVREDLELAEQIREVHQQSTRTYATPRLQAELRYRGRRHSRKRIDRIRRELVKRTLFANAGCFRKIKCKHGNAMCKWQRKLVRGTSWRARAWGQHVSFQKHPLKTWIRLLSADGECRLCD